LAKQRKFSTDVIKLYAVIDRRYKGSNCLIMLKTCFNRVFSPDIKPQLLYWFYRQNFKEKCYNNLISFNLDLSENLHK